jgi:hypothetical protein
MGTPSIFTFVYRGKTYEFGFHGDGYPCVAGVNFVSELIAQLTLDPDLGHIKEQVDSLIDISSQPILEMSEDDQNRLRVFAGLARADDSDQSDFAGRVYSRCMEKVLQDGNDRLDSSPKGHSFMFALELCHSEYMGIMTRADYGSYGYKLDLDKMTFTIYGLREELLQITVPAHTSMLLPLREICSAYNDVDWDHYGLPISKN